MALTVAQLSTYLGLGTPDAEQTVELQRVLDAGSAIVEEEAPAAPTAVKDLAIQRWAAYQQDQPFAARGQAFANGLVNSGAGAVLSRWIVRRL